MSDELILGDLAFESRLLIGMSKYSAVEVESRERGWRRVENDQGRNTF